MVICVATNLYQSPALIILWKKTVVFLAFVKSICSVSTKMTMRPALSVSCLKKIRHVCCRSLPYHLIFDTFDTALYTTATTDKYGKFTLDAGKPHVRICEGLRLRGLSLLDSISDNLFLCFHPSIYLNAGRKNTAEKKHEKETVRYYSLALRTVF